MKGNSRWERVRLCSTTNEHLSKSTTTRMEGVSITLWYSLANFYRHRLTRQREYISFLFRIFPFLKPLKWKIVWPSDLWDFWWGEFYDPCDLLYIISTKNYISIKISYFPRFYFALTVSLTIRIFIGTPPRQRTEPLNHRSQNFGYVSFLYFRTLIGPSLKLDSIGIVFQSWELSDKWTIFPPNLSYVRIYLHCFLP